MTEAANPFSHPAGLLKLSILTVKDLNPVPAGALVAGQVKAAATPRSSDPTPSSGEELRIFVSLAPKGVKTNLKTTTKPEASTIDFNEDFSVAVQDDSRYVHIYIEDQGNAQIAQHHRAHIILDAYKLPTDSQVEQWYPLAVPDKSHEPKICLAAFFHPITSVPEDFAHQTKKVTNLKLTLAKGDYMASEIIKGTLEMEVGYKFRVNNPIMVRASGFEYVRWHESDQDFLLEDQLVEHRVTYQGHNVLFEDTQAIYSNEEVLGAGTHKWEFQVTLPALLPPSIKLPHGKIEYYIEAKVNKYMNIRTVSIRSEAPFLQISDPIGPGQQITVWTPVRVSDKVKDRENEQMVTKHKIKINAWTNKRLVFLHEQPLHITLSFEVDNQSKREINKVRVMLIRRIKYRGDKSNLNGHTTILHKQSEAIIIPAKNFSTFSRKISFPLGYSQQSVTKDVGAKRISVKHALIIQLTKHNIINSKKKITMELPIYVGEHRGDHGLLQKLHLPDSCDELTMSVENFSV